MAVISFQFSGWMNDVSIDTVMEVETGKDVDVSKMPSQDVIEKLNSGVYAISLADALSIGGSNEEIEIRDFAAGDEDES